MEKRAERMTDKELARESWWNDNNCSGALPTEKIYECGFLAGLKAGRLKWYKVADGDLPPIHSTVLDENGDKVEYIGYGKWQVYSEYYERYVEVDPPIAWCEKPEYTEE